MRCSVYKQRDTRLAHCLSVKGSESEFYTSFLSDQYSSAGFYECGNEANRCLRSRMSGSFDRIPVCFALRSQRACDAMN